MWSRHSIPANLKSDSGPPINSQDLKTYTEALGIKWKLSTPLWPRGNANVESVMKPIGKLMKACAIEGTPWKQELQRFLLSYRTTPHKTTNVAPCELLYNRTIKGQLPQITKQKCPNKHKIAKENIERKKKSNKEYHDKHCRATESDIKEGDTVICLQPKRNKLTSKFSPELYTVVSRKDTTIIAENDRKSIKRDISLFKKIKQDIASEDQWEERPVGQGNVGNDEKTLRRSARNRMPVQRYGNVIPSDFIER